MALVGYDCSDDSEDDALDDDVVKGKISQNSLTFRKEIPVPTLPNVKTPCTVDVNTGSLLKQLAHRSMFN